MFNYNSQQEIAVTYPAKPLLILAGAGTGKTTTIVGRIAYLIQHKEALPESILALTFTNDAAENMKRKLAEEIDLQGNEIHACTFHAFAQSKTMQYFQHLGYTEKPKVMNRGDIDFLLRRRFDDLDTLMSKTFRRNPICAVQSFQKVFEAFRYNLLDNKELQKLQQKELDNKKALYGRINSLKMGRMPATPDEGYYKKYAPAAERQWFRNEEQERIYAKRQENLEQSYIERKKRERI